MYSSISNYIVDLCEILILQPVTIDFCHYMAPQKANSLTTEESVTQEIEDQELPSAPNYIRLKVHGFENIVSQILMMITPATPDVYAMSSKSSYIL